MSSDQTDEEKTYVQNSPAAAGSATIVTTRQQPATVVQNTVPASQRKETVVTHREMNTGALAGLVIGVVVLLAGVLLIDSQIKFLPWPYSIIVVLGFGLILLLVGAAFISRGAEP